MCACSFGLFCSVVSVSFLFCCSRVAALRAHPAEASAANVSWEVITTASDTEAWTAFERAWNLLISDTSADYASEQELNRYIFAEDDNGKPIYRFTFFEVVLTSNAYLDAEEGGTISEEEVVLMGWVVNGMGR